MKKTITLFFLLFIGIITNNAQNFQWAKSMGGTNFDAGSSIAVDGSGNVYTTGFFSGTADFDPGAGIFNLTSAGDKDIFISKLDAGGNFLWAKSIEGALANDFGLSIAVDGSGNVYTTGYFRGIADFNPGAGTFNLTATGNVDIFISKLDPAGNFLWAKSMGGSSIDAEGYSIALDGFGNIYTTGYFYGIVDFDPGSGTFNLTSAGWNDIFISKLDTAGDFLWAKSMGGTSRDWGYSIALDGSGNVYTTGFFEEIVDFDPGAGTFNLTSVGSYDIFISKLDAAGNFVWANKMGGISQDIGHSIKVDGSGNVYTTGSFYGTVDFDPEAGTFNLTSAGPNDIFISKLDAAGNFLWAKSMGGNSTDFGNSIVVDGSGDVYTTGLFSGTADFDPGAGTFNLTSAGNGDVFISKLDAGGNFLWAKGMNGASQCWGYSIALDASGNIYTTGSFIDTVDFDPGAGAFNLTTISSGRSDIFVHKLDQCTTTIGTNIVTACDSYSWIDGNTYTASNSTATYTIVNGAANGCDSVVTLSLTINNSTTGTDVVTACDSYMWVDGNTYTTSNSTATHTKVGGAVNGCDSIITLILTVNSCDSLFEIPNVFTPNKDGKNDLFKPLILSNIKSLKMKIYNRWGQLIYESNQKNEGWNGLTTAGITVPEGTYFYIIDAEIIENGSSTDKIFKGTLTLLR